MKTGMFQMKRVCIGGGKFTDAVMIDFSTQLVPSSINFNEIVSKGQKAIMIEMRNLKKFAKEIRDDWLGDKNSTRVVTGVFWYAFITYIFPILLDIGKVYVAFMIAQAFYQERNGGGGRDGRSGIQAVAYWAKWLILLYLLPFGVELIDQLGSHMYNELTEKGIESMKMGKGGF